MLGLTKCPALCRLLSLILVVTLRLLSRMVSSWTLRSFSLVHPFCWVSHCSLSPDNFGNCPKFLSIWRMYRWICSRWFVGVDWPLKYSMMLVDVLATSDPLISKLISGQISSSRTLVERPCQSNTHDPKVGWRRDTPLLLNIFFVAVQFGNRRCRWSELW